MAADRGDDFTPTGEDDTTVIDDPKQTELPLEDDKKVEDDKKTEDDDKKVDDDKKTDPEDKKAEPRIPLSRHKQLLETSRSREQALETQLAEALKAGNREQQKADLTKTDEAIAKLREKFVQQMLDGEVKEALATSTEIDRLKDEKTEAATATKIEAAEARAVERVRYDVVVVCMEAAYPQINPDHDDFDRSKVQEVMELRDAFEVKGYAPSQALQRAMKYVFPATTTAQETATEVTPRVAVDDVKKATADERKKEAVAKALDPATKTPPNSSKVGVDSDKAGGGVLDAKAVMKMSQKDFAALDEEQLAKLRGDTL